MLELFLTAAICHGECRPIAKAVTAPVAVVQRVRDRQPVRKALKAAKRLVFRCRG